MFNTVFNLHFVSITVFEAQSEFADFNHVYTIKF